MLKADALDAFKGTVGLAKALGVAHPAICKLPPVLKKQKADQVRGAMVRLRMRIPPHMRDDRFDEERLAQLQREKAAEQKPT